MAGMSTEKEKSKKVEGDEESLNKYIISRSQQEMNISHLSEDTPGGSTDLSFNDLLESAKKQSLNESSDLEDTDNSQLI